MEKYDLGDPRPPMPIGMDDLDREILKAKQEIIGEIVSLQRVLEDRDPWRWAVFALLCAILWKVW